MSNPDRRLRLAQAHRPAEPDRDRNRRLRLLSARARRRLDVRHHLQHRPLEPRELQAARARSARDRGEVSRVAPRRLHHPHRHAGGDHARQGLRGGVGQADHRRDRIARHHQHPLGDPRARPSRRPQRRGADALSAGAAPVGAGPSSTASGFHVVADHTEDVVFKQLQDVTPAQIAAAAKRVLASAPSADGIYIPCNQWSAPMPRR